MESGQVPATPVPPGRIFVGREHEFDELIAGHDSASSSRGSLYLVSGGPGAGKTRLIDEFTARAGELGSAVFWGRCWEVGGAPAYWPWVQILRGLLRGPDVDALIVQLGPGAAYVAQLVPEVAHRSADTPTIVSLDSDQARFALFDAVASLLRAAAAQRPLVIVLDDLHGGDVPSLLLLRFVAQEIRTAPIQVIGTYREVEAALSPETGPVISELARDSHVLALRGLSEADVQLFIERTWGEPRSELASAVHERTEGNPLFVSEILRLLTRENDGAAQRVHSQRFEVPASVRESIRRRVQLLPEDAREVLGVASVIGREFNLAVLGELTDVGTDALLDVLDEAIVAGLVGEVANAPSQYIFSHALVRETMYADIPSARRTKLHGTVAEVLERLHATDLEPREAEIAHHYFEALPSGNPQRAVDYATRAGRRCMKLLAYEKASSHFRQAIEVIDQYGSTDPEGRSELSLGLGEAQWRAGEIADARETFKIVADAAARSGNREHAARAALGYGGAMRPAVGLVDQDLVALLNAALEMLGTEESGLKARAMARLAIELYYSDRKEERVRLGRAAAEMARRGGDPATLAYCLNGLHYALWGPEFLDEQMSSATEVLQIAEEIGDPDLVLRGHFWRMGHFLEAGDIAAADRELEACVALSERLRQPFYKEWATRFRAMRAAFAGRFDESERLALEALAIGQRVGDTEALGLFGLQLFLLRRLQGRLAELEEPVRTYVEQYPAIPGWRSGLACLYSDIDRDAEARREFEVLAQRGFAGIPHDHTWLPAMNFAAETCRFLGDDQRAGQLYEQLLPYENRQIVVGGGIGYYGPVTRPLALLAETAGRTDDALRHFAAAERAAAAMGATAWLEQVRFEAARARLERDPDDAEAGLAIDECLANARSLGMARLEELITRMKLPQSIASSTPRTATLTREGEYWSVSFSGAVFRLHDAKGLHHMSKLVQRPGSEVHVLELAGGLGSSDRTSAREAEEAGLSMGADDAGDLLDPAAKAAYKRRLDDLEAELQEAEEFNDSGRAASAKAEIEFLARELSSALGLTGRSRKSASSAERARLTVTKAIRSAVKKVAENDPALGRHLEARLKTGTYCSYQPDPDSPVTWNVTS